MQVSNLGPLRHPDHLHVLLAQSTRRPVSAASIIARESLIPGCSGGPFSSGHGVPFHVAVTSIEPRELADRAVDALHTHRYQRLQVDVDGPDIIIAKTISTGALPVETYNRSDPAAALTESGLAAHLAVAGPVRPAQLASAIEKSTDRWASMNILDTTGRGLTVPADDQPDPASIDPDLQRGQDQTRGRDRE